MKTSYCDAWPCEVLKKDAEVFPKNEISVQNVETLLKEAFTNITEDPKELLVEKITKEPAGPQGPVAFKDHGETIKYMWAAFAVLAFFSFYSITTLVSRVENLESWLHGRLMTRP